MRYWCLITSKENWNICKKRKLWGLDYRYHTTLEKFLKKGDKAIVYCHGKKFVAEIEIKSKFFYENESIGWTKKIKKEVKPYTFPYRLKIKIINEGEFPIGYSIPKQKNRKKIKHNNNKIDNIIFITDKSESGKVHFFVSVLPICKEDFEYISNNLKKRKVFK